jgi:hypothetical protein
VPVVIFEKPLLNIKTFNLLIFKNTQSASKEIKLGKVGEEGMGTKDSLGKQRNRTGVEGYGTGSLSLTFFINFLFLTV